MMRFPIQDQLKLFEKRVLQRHVEEAQKKINEIDAADKPRRRRCQEAFEGEEKKFADTMPEIANRMDPQWNKLYVKDATDEDATEAGGSGCIPVYWEGPLEDGRDRGSDYYCPEGFTKHSIQFGTQEEFEEAFKGWPIVYHGTEQCAVVPILNTHIKKARADEYYYNGTTTKQSAYFSRSIVYCSHSRYAAWIPLEDGIHMIQYILECRVNPNAIVGPFPETLHVKYHGDPQIDRNFQNNEMELLVHPENDEVFLTNKQVVCTGLMVRIRKESEMTHSSPGVPDYKMPPPLPGNLW